MFKYFAQGFPLIVFHRDKIKIPSDYQTIFFISFLISNFDNILQNMKKGIIL